MHTPAPQPTARRVASLLWFPFFFAAAFGLIGLYTFHQPAPHDMRVVVTPATDVRSVTSGLARVEDDGFVVETVASTAAARELVEKAQVAAAIDGQQVYLSSAASPLRARFLTAVVPHALGPEASVVDVRPTSSGDVSGVSIFFYGLPLLLVGLITSIVLVQLGMWPVRNKLAAIAATGAFASIVTYLVATGLDAVPSDPRLPLYGFLLTQTIGWLTTAAALSLKQFFMPAAMTFVLILGIPSSGGTVSGDMLPASIGWLNDVLPFAQLIDATRASAYASGAGLARPLLILSAWAIAGIALLLWAAWRSRTGATASPPADQPDAMNRASSPAAPTTASPQRVAASRHSSP
ncbi:MULTISPECIES: ABC transporter permease [Nocardioides]|uniref:ABC transporter permease n=1 Tax=Nocardioides vastitatis TaxID=2568655 RepID=A0ABW0ZES5_9ACTN|nr:ABC transporter permease [Nocardioides sp.]